MKQREHIFATVAEWKAEGKHRYGEYIENWKFKCPNCGAISTGAEYKAAGAEMDAIYCECIGRYKKDKGCKWAAYGLFDICTTEVAGRPVFDFA